MKPNKIICLMPVKNERDILPITLPIISKYCDIIIIADQMSDDGSRDIYKNYSKVRVIDNLRERQSNQVRWDLLQAARQYEGHNLLIALDADEYFPPALFNNFINKYDFNVGESFRFPWIQLWKQVNKYNNQGAWFRNYQRCAWIDDGKTNYSNEVDVIDDLPRVPTAFLSQCKRISELPVIHLQWVMWEKTQLKQAWYRCIRLMHSPNDYKKINCDYSHGLDCNNNLLDPVPAEWIGGVDFLDKVEKFGPTWHFIEICKLFDTYGITFFEKLQIWHIKSLADEFIRREGRSPVSSSSCALNRRLEQLIRSLIKQVRY